MRRVVLVLLSALVTVGMLAPIALAQTAAPTPKVTITGQIDNIMNLNRNLNNTTQDRTVRGGQTAPADREFGAYTRGRWDIIGELGKAKAVMGWEIDLHYGGFGPTNADTCVGTHFSGTPAGNCGSRGDGSSGGLDADTDVRVPIELKWMYVEFPLTGPGSLLSFIPFEGAGRVGGQPFSLGMKPQQFADADFAGFRAEIKFTPNVKLIALYQQIEEDMSGPRTTTGATGTVAGTAGSTGWNRGDDWGAIIKLDVEPIKGVRISPFFGWQELDGSTSGAIRTPAGGYGVAGANMAPDIAATTAIQTSCLTIGTGKCRSTQEHRRWLGLDLRIDQGPFYIGPPLLYLNGERSRLAAATEPGRPGVVHAHENAWLFDLESGFRLGPLNLQGRFAYGSGNKPEDNLNKSMHYMQLYQTGGGYFNGFGEVSGSANIAYLSGWNGTTSGNPYSINAHPTYDRYGLIRLALKATYSVTPAFDVYGSVSPMWTAEKVNTLLTNTGNGMAIPAGRDGQFNLAPGTATRPCDNTCKETAATEDFHSRFLGVDLSGGITYRFAPGVTFDLGGGILFAGKALANSNDIGLHAGGTASGTFDLYGPGNSYSLSTRIRYAF